MTTASAPTVPAAAAPMASRSAGRRYRHALRLLTVRDLRVRYSTSALGYLWSILDPLVMSAIYWFVFTQVFHRGKVGEEPYIVFLLSALLITWSARISLVALMAATMFGYLLRLGILFVAVYAVKDTAWISLPALGAAIIVTHLGLLVWELRYVSISLAYPGLKPNTPSSSPASTNS